MCILNKEVYKLLKQKNQSKIYIVFERPVKGRERSKSGTRHINKYARLLQRV